MKYTKGKWCITGDKDGNPSGIISLPGATPICEICNGNKANAHLIAAAPDMYQVLQECVSAMDASAETENTSMMDWAIRQAEVALAKAENK